MRKVLTLILCFGLLGACSAEAESKEYPLTNVTWELDCSNISEPDPEEYWKDYRFEVNFTDKVFVTAKYRPDGTVKHYRESIDILSKTYDSDTGTKYKILIINEELNQTMTQEYTINGRGQLNIKGNPAGCFYIVKN